MIRKHSPAMLLSSLLFIFFLGCGSSTSFTEDSNSTNPGGAKTLASESSLEGADAAASTAPLMRTANLAEFRKASDWGSGFTGEVTITNTTGQTIKDWQLSFTMASKITNLWNATQLGREGEVYRLVAMDYNNSLAPGQKITLGFNAAPGGPSQGATQLVFEWPEDPATPSPTPTPTTTPIPTPIPDPEPTTTPSPDPSPAPTGQVDYRISSDWGSGFGAQVEVRNPSTSSMEDWTLTFQLSAQIDSIWNATILSHQGTTYKIGPKSYNQTIPAGGSISFGFNASPGGGAAQATDFLVSGQAETAPAPTPTPDPDPIPDPDPDPNPNPAAPGFYSTSGSKLVDSAGETVYLNGLNWFGMETETFAPHGLWTRSMDSMLDQMVSLGYNTLRVPFSNQALRSQSVPNGIDFSKNPDLSGKSAVQILDILVAKAGQRGMKIFLDRHRPDASAQSDLWYTSSVSEEQWISDWEMLALRYKNNPTVIGADLHNEPHGRATWGSGQISTDWRLAAQRAGNRILAANPDWLIIVEGVENGPSGNYWWGGNLSAAGSKPVTLSVPNRLVYSTHDYATSVFPQSWFSAPNFPDNLEGIWDSNWGYLLKQNIAPVIVGEFGTKYEASVDQVWLQKLTQYMSDNGASFTYWSWNPNSTDTGGILKDDWNSVQTAKQAVLQALLAR